MNATDKEKFAFIRSNEYFKEINDEGIESLLTLSSEVLFVKEQFVFHENDPSDNFYIIRTGELEVVKSIGTGDQADFQVIRTLGVNEIFGELCLLTDKPRSAGIRAKTDARLISFPASALNTKENIKHFFPLFMSVGSEVANRLSDTTETVVEMMKKALKKTKRLMLYEFIMILILASLLFQTGMIGYYIYHTDDYCKLKYEQQHEETAGKSPFF